MNISEAHFWKFASRLTISTKELGDTTLAKPMGTQRYFIREVFEGLDKGINTFVVLKGRQLGISTIMLALDLYWVFMHGGISAGIVTHDEPARDDFRMKLTQYFDSLPKAWRIESRQHNRNQFVFNNKSGIVYMIAGSRAKSKLGRSKALTFLHATEIGSWGDNREGLAALQASLAEKHPHRLFVYESTANGYDMFYDMWESAESAVTEKAIFVPWWMNEFYSVTRDSDVYKTYIGELKDESKLIKRLDATEVEWFREVQRQFGYTLTSEQMAWWRFKLYEKHSGELDMMHQEFPPVPEYAFRLTGSQYFGSMMLNDARNIAQRASKDAMHHRVTWGASFGDTTFEECTHKTSNLVIWEPPDPNGWYAVGADAAFGSNEWKDASVAQIFRVFSDKAIQVGEFCSEVCTPTEFAWTVAILCGWYGKALLNIEVNGPGQVVLQEIEHLRKMSYVSRNDADRSINNVFRHLRQYQYHKFNGSNQVTGTRHWVTNQGTKERMLATLRDGIKRGMIEVRSLALVEQMQTVIRDGSYIGGEGRKKDDRVIAAALAVVAWADNQRVQMAALNNTWKMHQEAIQSTPNNSDNSWILRDYLKRTAATARR